VVSFQDNYFSENVVAPGDEPRTSASVAKESDHKTIEAAAQLRFELYKKRNNK
jgi:hypothetical protein